MSTLTCNTNPNPNAPRTFPAGYFHEYECKAYSGGHFPSRSDRGDAQRAESALSSEDISTAIGRHQAADWVRPR